MSNVVIISTLDTKGKEIEFLKNRIEDRGATTIILNCGVLDEPEIVPDVPSSEIAELGGGELKTLRDNKDRGEAMEVMGNGAKIKLQELNQEGKVDGVIGIGGSGNTSIATQAMRGLPVGIPKLMVSTMASGDVSSYVGIKDVAIMYSVGDIEGLNQLTSTILNNAAGAIVGMAQIEEPEIEEKPTVGITMFGVTTPAVQSIRSKLEEKGMEVLVFHATGSGGRAMESLVDQGIIEGVIDLTTTEVADEVVGGVLSAGPDRLEMGVNKNIPQVLAPGALDMVNFGPEETVPDEFQDRNLHIHNPQVTLMRTTPEENEKFARFIAKKLKPADPKKVGFLFPREGVSMLDKEGEDFYDPEADRTFLRTLKEKLPEEIEVEEMDAHINDEKFAELVTQKFLSHARTANLI